MINPHSLQSYRINGNTLETIKLSLISCSSPPLALTVYYVNECDAVALNSKDRPLFDEASLVKRDRNEIERIREWSVVRREE